jgi:hypothetical protein
LHLADLNRRQVGGPFGSGCDISLILNPAVKSRGQSVAPFVMLIA